MMDFIHWTPEYSVQIKEFDKQHQGLIEILNTLYENRDGSFSQRREIVGVAILQLKEYANQHFAAEEKLLLQFNYPEYAQHKAEHQFFIKTINEFIQIYRSGSQTLSSKTINFLNEWFSKHILVTDKQYAPFLNVQGIH
jgi:hemerythrin